MPKRLFTKIATATALCLGVVALAACADDNHPPSLGLLLDQQVTVGQSVRIILTAADADGDKITFSAKGLPLAASLTARSRTEAVIAYSPVITDTEPGGRRYEITVEAADGQGGIARQDFGLIVFPTFGVPAFDLPSGVVLNLAQDDDLALLVEVKDDDSTEVTLAMTEGPEGAKLQRAGAKSAFFYWKPSDAQREVAVHRAIFTATDESHAPTEHVLTLVLLNPEKQSGCEGTPPTVSHAAPADQTLSGPLELSVSATDADSQVQGVTLHWTRGDPRGSTTAVVMERQAEGSPIWVGRAELGSVPSAGALVYYYFVTTDNDDPTGISCDQSARTPKSAWFTAAVYGSSGAACLDDDAEPDGSLGSAPTLPAGTWPGRRICGADTDLVAIGGAEEGMTVSAALRWNPQRGPLSLRLVDAGGAPLAEDGEGVDGELLVRHDVEPGQRVFAEVRSSAADARISYTLELGVDAVACEDDGYEPNSGPSEATPLGLGSYEGLQICAGDSDFFRVSVGAGERLRFAIAFEDRYGDLDIELRDSDGVSVLATSASEKSTEEIDYDSPSAKDVFLRVYGVDGARNIYALSITADASGGCPEDALGESHRPEDAVTLFEDVYEGFKACADAPDWFVVELNGGETLGVVAQTLGDPVAIDIYDSPEGSPVASDRSQLDDDIALVEFQRPDPGALYYRISTAASEIGYVLLQTVSDPPGACQDDRLEPNGVGAPVALGEGVFTWLRLCGESDIDAFEIEVEPFTTLTVLTNHELRRGFTDLRLLGPDGVELARVEDQEVGAYLETLLEQGGRYTVLVEPFEVGEGLGYDLALFFD